MGQPLSRIIRLAEGVPGVADPLVDPITQALRSGRDLRDLPAVLEDKRDAGPLPVRLCP